MRNLGAIMAHGWPKLVPLRDYEVTDDGSGPKLVMARGKAAPSLWELAAAEDSWRRTEPKAKHAAEHALWSLTGFRGEVQLSYEPTKEEAALAEAADAALAEARKRQAGAEVTLAAKLPPYQAADQAWQAKRAELHAANVRAKTAAKALMAAEQAFAKTQGKPVAEQHAANDSRHAAIREAIDARAARVSSQADYDACQAACDTTNAACGQAMMAVEEAKKAVSAANAAAAAIPRARAYTVDLPEGVPAPTEAELLARMALEAETARVMAAALEAGQARAARAAAVEEARAALKAGGLSPEVRAELVRIAGGPAVLETGRATT